MVSILLSALSTSACDGLNGQAGESRSTGATRPSMTAKPCGVCIQLLEARIYVAEMSVPAANHHRGKEVEPRSDLRPFEQQHAREACLQKERCEHLPAEERSGNASYEYRITAPIGTAGYLDLRGPRKLSVALGSPRAGRVFLKFAAL